MHRNFWQWWSCAALTPPYSLTGKPIAFDLDTGTRALAARADGKSGRDLRSWVEGAEHSAVARAIDTGDPDAIVIELGDFG